MKIDTTKIPNFDTLPDDAKNAILGMEFADAPDMSQFVAKSVFDKKASEAADLSKQLKSRMTEDEAKAAQEAADRAALVERAEKAEQALALSTYVSAYVALGYDEKLARSTAEAMIKGDTETVFKNQRTHMETREKALRAELLKQTPPPAGGTPTDKTREDFQKMSLADKQKFAAENPEVYASFYKN